MTIPNHFSSLTQAAYQAARKAGELLKKGFNTDFKVSPKKMKNDVVTQYDFASEDLIVATLSEQFPSHSFLCEESGASNNNKGPICWIIDPLDGTVNFAHHVPLFSISIAACKGEEILCGVIYAPMTDEMFVAEQYQGAYLNGQRLSVSTQKSIFASYVATSLSFNLHKDPTRSIELFSQIANLGFPMRAFGSASLDLAYVSAGKLDAYWSSGGTLNPWDVAAGKLLIDEAGGKITQCNGEPYLLTKEMSVLATNGKLHQELLQYLNPEEPL
jgi:myo-inositol-1(or 4)-monophosphatase